MTDDRFIPESSPETQIDRGEFVKRTMGLVAGAVVLPGLAGVAAPRARAATGAQQVDTVAIALSRGINSAPLWNLANVGPDLGIQPRYSELFTYADQVRAVQSGQVQVSTSGITNPATLLDSGVTNVKVVAGMLWGGSNIVLRKGVTANSWKELEGKTIGVSPGTYARIEFLIAAKTAGADLSKINLVNTSSAATALQSLSQGQVDGIVLFSPTTDQAVLQDVAYYPANLDIGSSPLGPANGVILANTDFIRTETGKRFMRAYVASVKQMQKKANFVRLGMTVTGLPAEVIELAYKYLYFDYLLDTTALARASALGPEYGFAKADVSARISSMLDYTLLSAATKKSAGALTGTPGAALAQVRPYSAETVDVTITDKAIKVAPASVKAGTVIFNVVNNGKKPHTFSIAGKTSVKLAPKKIAQIKLTLDKGAHPFRSTLKGDARLRGKVTVTG